MTSYVLAQFSSQVVQVKQPLVIGASKFGIEVYTSIVSIMGHLSMICFYFEFVRFFQVGFD